MFLKQIKDKFDDFPKYGYSDHSYIDRVKFSNLEGSCFITCFGGGCGSAYDPFTINFPETDSFFGKKPRQAEMVGGLIGLYEVKMTSAAQVDKNGLVICNGYLMDPKKYSKIIKQGNESFELFEKLFDELQSFKPLLQSILSNFDSEGKAEYFDYERTDSGSTYDVERKELRVLRGCEIKIADKNKQGIYAKLDAGGIIPIEEENSRKRKYHSGIVQEFASSLLAEVETTYGTKLKVCTGRVLSKLKGNQLDKFNGLEEKIKSFIA